MRIVVKVGTSTLAYATGRLNIRHTEQLVKVLSDLKNEGHEVILVSSGAIGTDGSVRGSNPSGDFCRICGSHLYDEGHQACIHVPWCRT